MQGKPNIMLLMDTSGSMAWTHMPDEVEKVGTIDYTGSIGYRSTQCNSIYYNPAVDYILPKYPDGTFFPQPSFNAAPYAGFVSYYTAADATDLSSVDLATSFRAFDAKTLRAQGSVPRRSGATGVLLRLFRPADADVCVPGVPPGRSGRVGRGDRRRHLDARCGQLDLRAARVAPTSAPTSRPGIPSTGLGLSLIKTAASLAFNPLTDSFRVGLITVEPKTNPTDSAINPSKYVAIADFTAPQRSTWFSSLFSQPAEGASPAREGLARVGRHYAGKQDGINNGMTGDPVQYSCQQNFTIMTTDGYWNSQTETPGAGPVEMDGTSPVAVAGVRNPDGTWTPPTGLSPRPIWEGFASDTSVTTDNRNLFAYAPCGNYMMQSTSQASITTTQLTYATSQLVTRTAQTTESTRQLSESSTRVEQSTLQRRVATSQTFQTDTQVRQSTTQITESRSGMAADHHPAAAEARARRSEHHAASAANPSDHPEYFADRPQYAADANCNFAHRPANLADHAHDRTGDAEHVAAQHQHLADDPLDFGAVTKHGPMDPANVAGPDMRCAYRRLLAGRHGRMHCGRVLLLRDRHHRADPGRDVQPGHGRLRQQLRHDHLHQCHHRAGTRRELHPTGRQLRQQFHDDQLHDGHHRAHGSGVLYAFGSDLGQRLHQYDLRHRHQRLDSDRFVHGAVAERGKLLHDDELHDADDRPDRRRLVLAGGRGSGNSWTATTCGTNNTGPAGVSSCTPALPSSGNGYTTTTCNTVNNGPTAVSSCTPAAAGSGNSWVATTCTPVTTGPTPVASCSPSGATAVNNWTTTTCPNVVGTPVAVSSCTPVAGTSPTWTATTCTPVNTGPTGVASCSPSGPISPTWTTTTCGTNNTGWTAVACCTPVSPGSGNAYTTTQCQTVPTGPTSVASCTPATASSGNAFTTTTCNTIVVQPWTNVGTCTPAAASAGNGFVATLCQTVNGPPVGVASCTPSAPNGSGQGVICNNLLTGPIGVASCTPQTGNSGNGWVTITCGTSNTGPTLVASCTASGPTSGNNYTTTSCAPTVVGPTAVASCTAAVAGPVNSFTARSLQYDQHRSDGSVFLLADRAERRQWIHDDVMPNASHRADADGELHT